LTNIHTLAARGIKHLIGRQFVIQVLTIGGGIVLARRLDPADFGLYAIALFWIETTALIGDFGLAPSFIQRKAELEDIDLRVGFTLQQLITTAVVVVLVVAAPWIATLYPEAPPETVWLIRALALSLYMTTWRAMSVLQLERKLNYRPLAWIEVAETVCWQAIAIGLAIAGYGVWSFVFATLARGILGAALVFRAAPWRVRFAFETAIAKNILRFGVPFQIGNIINNMSTWLTPTMVAVLLGPQAVGYLSWSAAHGKKPLMLVDNVMRVTFSHLSRIQEDRNEVERIIVRYLTYLLIPAGLWFSVLAVSAPALVQWVYTGKWTPAVPALVLFALATSLDVIVWVVSMSMSAVGLAGTAARRALYRTVAILALSVPAVLLFGFIGIPAAYVVALLVTLPVTFSGLAKGSMFRILRPLWWLVVPVLASVVCAWPVTLVPITVGFNAVLSSAVGTLVFVLVGWKMAPDWLRQSASDAWPRSLLPNGGAAA